MSSSPAILAGIHARNSHHHERSIPMNERRRFVLAGLVLLGLGLALGFWWRGASQPAAAEDRSERKDADKKDSKETKDSSYASSTELYFRQSPGARAKDREANDYGLWEDHAPKLNPYPRTTCRHPS